MNRSLSAALYAITFALSTTCLREYMELRLMVLNKSSTGVEMEMKRSDLLKTLSYIELRSILHPKSKKTSLLMFKLASLVSLALMGATSLRSSTTVCSQKGGILLIFFCR